MRDLRVSPASGHRRGQSVQCMLGRYSTNEGEGGRVLEKLLVGASALAVATVGTATVTAGVAAAGKPTIVAGRVEPQLQHHGHGQAQPA